MTEDRNCWWDRAVKITCSKDELARALALVARAVSTRTTVQILSGSLAARLRGSPRARGDRHGAVAAPRRSRPRSEGDGAVVVPGRLLVDIARLLPAERGRRSSTGRSKASLEVTCGPASYPLHTYSAEDFPQLPEVERAQTFAVDREALLETVARVGRVSVAGRVAPGADRHPRSLRRREARHGRDRLLPARRQGDGARRRHGAGARGDRPGPRAHGARADRPGRRASCSSACRRTTSSSAPATSG